MPKIITDPTMRKLLHKTAINMSFKNGVFLLFFFMSLYGAGQEAPENILTLRDEPQENCCLPSSFFVFEKVKDKWERVGSVIRLKEGEGRYEVSLSQKKRPKSMTFPIHIFPDQSIGLKYLQQEEGYLQLSKKYWISRQEIERKGYADQDWYKPPEEPE